jgi:hypothetical protein
LKKEKAMSQKQPKSDDRLTVETTTLASGEQVVALRKANSTAPLVIPGATEKAYATYAQIDDMATHADAGVPPTIKASDMVTHAELLKAFASESLGEKNLSHIWENNLNALVDTRAHQDPGFEIAQNHSETGFAITTLEVISTDGKNPVPIHVVLNNKTKQGLIVGDEKISDTLRSAFNKAGLNYINRHEENADLTTEAALRKLTAGEKKATISFLRDAFGYRNDIQATTKQLSQPLSELLVDANVEQMFEKFVTKQHAKHAL